MLEFLRPYGITADTSHADAQIEFRHVIITGNLEVTGYLLDQCFIHISFCFMPEASILIGIK